MLERQVHLMPEMMVNLMGDAKDRGEYMRKKAVEANNNQQK
jgi:hypothetical protein